MENIENRTGIEVPAFRQREERGAPVPW